MQTDNIRQIQWGRNASWGHIDSAYQEYGAMMSDVLFSTVIFPCGIELRRHEVLYLSLIMGKVSRKKEAIYRIPDAETGISSLMARDIASRTVTLALIIIIILISFGVYFTALFNGFVHDDLTQVLENQWIKSVSHIPEIFTKSVWSFKSEITSSNYYRPMM